VDSPGGRVRSRARLGRIAALLLALAFACDKQHAPELPPAEVYETPVEIVGTWRGEVGGSSGSLEVERLDAQRLRGLFEAASTGRRYVMSMQQVKAPAPDGTLAPSNLVQFTWQDGHGDRGEGWLLVNRDGSALTGSYGHGEGNTDGAGAWTFVRQRGADDRDGLEIEIGGRRRGPRAEQEQEQAPVEQAPVEQQQDEAPPADPG